jgi:hypothetical protein
LLHKFSIPDINVPVVLVQELAHLRENYAAEKPLVIARDG